MVSQSDILDAFRFRHACKTFDATRKIPAADFRFILETGRLSPASFGLEPWRFVVIQNPVLRERLKGVTWGAQTQLPTASHFLAILVRKAEMRHDAPWLADFMRDIQNLPEERIAPRCERLRQFQESDFRLFDCERSLFDWSCRQAYIALANMMTAAAMIGVDSCPIEGFDQRAAETVLEEAGLLEKGRFGLAVMCAFGYRVNAQPPKTRQTLEAVTHWVD